MEDGWILARAIEREHNRYSSNFVKDALEIFEEIRLPYYKRMCVQYTVLQPRRTPYPRLGYHC